MKCFDNGSLFSVTCSRLDVTDFARRWPCFGPRNPITFQFEKSTGDLVDVSRRTDENDGTGICALADDAKAYGLAVLRRKKLADLRKIITAARKKDGTVECAAIISGRRVSMCYQGWSTTASVRRFCDHLLDYERVTAPY